MSPRTLFSILAVLLVYLSLSLYHGQQVKKLPDPGEGGTIETDSLSAKDREKNWIQVTTEADGLTPAQPEQGDDGFLSGPEAPGPARAPVDHGVRVGIQGPPRSSVSEDPVELRSALEREKMKADNLAREKESLLFRVDALKSELVEVSNRLQAWGAEPHQSAGTATKQHNPQTRPQEEPGDSTSADTPVDSPRQPVASGADALIKANEKIGALSQQLRQAAILSADAEKTIQELNTSLAVEKNNRQRALDAARGTRKECEQYLVEIGRLQTLLKETQSKLVAAESEITRSRLKAEAMLHYGREQDRLVTPFRQEIEQLHARLENMNSNLVQSERQVADLRATEQQLRQQIGGQRPDEVSAPMEGIMPDLEPTAAGEQQD